MTEEIENLTMMFSDASKDLVKLTIEHRELQKKFNDYYQKTDAYLKDREKKIVDLEGDVKRLQDEYSSFDKRFADKNKECDQLKKDQKSLNNDKDELNKQNTMQRKKIQFFEEKYKGIEIGKMHEEIESIKTKYYAAQVGEQEVTNKLYNFREKIIQIFNSYEHTKEAEIKKMNEKPKSYNGPARAFEDPVMAQKIREVEQRAKRKLSWRGGEDLEVFCGMFTMALTAPSGIHIEDDTPVQQISPSKLEDKKPEEIDDKEEEEEK